MFHCHEYHIDKINKKYTYSCVYIYIKNETQTNSTIIKYAPHPAVDEKVAVIVTAAAATQLGRIVPIWKLASPLATTRPVYVYSLSENSNFFR